jgi:hypothetical protein
MTTILLWAVAASSLLVGGFLGIFLFPWRKKQSAQPPAGKSTTATPSAPAHVPERRASPRRWGDPIQILLLVDNLVMAEPIRGWVLNRSAGGLGLTSTQSLMPGTVISVHVAHAPDSVPWVRLEVKGCQPQTGRWLLNCQYSETPPKEVVLLFR